MCVCVCVCVYVCMRKCMCVCVLYGRSTVVDWHVIDGVLLCRVLELVTSKLCSQPLSLIRPNVGTLCDGNTNDYNEF